MSAREIELPIARASRIWQTYTLHPTPQAAANHGRRGQTETIIEISSARGELDVLGYDWIPAGQPLPVRSRIVGYASAGRYRPLTAQVSRCETESICQ